MTTRTRRRDERGATTAEYSVGTIGAVLVAGVVFRVLAPFAEELGSHLIDVDRIWAIVSEALNVPGGLRRLLPRVLPW